MGGALASQRADEFWRNAAATLNSFGDGTSKAGPAWKTYWHELKYRARKRETDIRQHTRGTGGGPGKKPLTITESRILALLGQVSYAGNPEVQIPLSNPQNAGPYIPPPPSPPSPQGVQNPLSNHASPPPVSPPPVSPPPVSPPPVSPPPVSPSASSSEDSMAVGPRRGRTAALRNTRPYRRHRYDDPPVWARRYEEQRLRIDRGRARLLERLVEIAEEALALYRRSMEQ